MKSLIHAELSCRLNQHKRLSRGVGSSQAFFVSRTRITSSFFVDISAWRIWLLALGSCINLLVTSRGDPNVSAEGDWEPAQKDRWVQGVGCSSQSLRRKWETWVLGTDGQFGLAWGMNRPSLNICLPTSMHSRRSPTKKASSD